jgi:hypothetical protein
VVSFNSAYQAKLMGLGAKIFPPEHIFITVKLHLKNNKVLNSKNRDSHLVEGKKQS